MCLFEQKMKKVLFITNSISFGGASKMLCFVAESLAARGHRILIVNLHATRNVTNFERALSGVDVVTVSTPSKFKHLYRLKEIRKIAHAYGAEVIIGFTAFPNFYSVIISKILHIPSIVSERGDPYHTFNSSLKDKILKLIINQSSGAVFQTKGASEFYGKRLQKRGRIIPNPIYIKNDTIVNDSVSRENTIVSVGRIDNTQKRYDIMLKAFSLFSRHHPQYSLLLYGRGVDEGDVKEWCGILGLEKKVRFMGLTTNPMQDISNASIFLITSDYEGISNSLLEAMAVGLPCVSTDSSPGGARMLIKDHVNGLLVPVGDVEAIAKALCEFAEDPVLASKCGKNAKNVIRRFDANTIIDMWESYVTYICNGE